MWPMPQVKEPSLECLARGKKVYEPPRFMSVNTAVEQLLEVEAKRGGGAASQEGCCAAVWCSCEYAAALLASAACCAPG